MENRYGPEEQVNFESSDGLTLAGTYRRIQGRPKGSVVLAHGILTHRDYAGFYPELAAELARGGFESLRFDFRGHGDSDGTLEQMTIAGEVDDLAAAVEFVRSRHHHRIGIVGTSLGAGIAVLHTAGAPRPPFALVLLGSVLDYRRTFLEPETPWAEKWFTPSALARAHTTGVLSLGNTAIGLGLIREFETVKPAEILRDLSVPVLMIHGDEDPVAPFHVARGIARASSNVTFARVGGAKHYFEGSEKRVFRSISQWLGGEVHA
jgi:alpha-beta hydrolase superfamily lysophospholipase